MKKSVKLNKKNTALTVAVTAIVVGIVLFAALVLLLPNLAKSGDGEETTAAEQTEIKRFDPIELGEGIVLTALSKASGPFPEDGSNTNVENVLCATFENTAKKTLQYAKVFVTVGDKIYNFEFTTIPAGESVVAFETTKASANNVNGDISAEAEYIVFFETEPTLFESDLEISVSNGMITVKNISGKDIDKEISLFYKNKIDGKYMGGITYRVRVSGIKAGETVSGYSSHADESSTKVMFCQYGV